MSFEPTPSQALLLFGLLARHGECPQAELMPAVKKADREALVKAKVIEATKLGNAYQLKINEQEGWAWCSKHLSAELPPAYRAFSDMLTRLGDHLTRSGGTLADFIGAKPALASTPKPPPTIKAKPTATAKRSKSSLRPKVATTSKKTLTTKAKVGKVRSSPKTPTPSALRKRIEAAYLVATGGRKNENVKLSRLRRELADLDRPTVDAALTRILKSDKKASLARDDNTRQLDQSDHDAAFNPSGEPFHLIWISS